MRHIETYKHYFAKILLAEWFSRNYHVETEKQFVLDGKLLAVADLAVMEGEWILAVYEITNKHGLMGKKLALYQLWAYYNYDIEVCEVSADTILNATSMPAIVKHELVNCDKYFTNTRK